MIELRKLSEIAKYLVIANGALFTLITGFVASTVQGTPALALSTVSPLANAGFGFVAACACYFVSFTGRIREWKDKWSAIVLSVAAASMLIWAGVEFILSVTVETAREAGYHECMRFPHLCKSGTLDADN